MTEERAEIISILRYMLASEVRSAAPETNLFEAGLIDSLGMLDLVEEVGARFGLTLDQSEITLDNFASLDRIVALVERHNAKSKDRRG